jgi:hypothetical protein
VEDEQIPDALEVQQSTATATTSTAAKIVVDLKSGLVAGAAFLVGLALVEGRRV